MANGVAPNDFGGRTSVRVALVGDRGTGKSSLIVTIAADSFPEAVPHVLPPTRLPSDFYPDRVPITLIDTSSSPEHRGKLTAECKLADVVILTYACDQPSTLDRLSTFWLPELRRLEVKVPVIVVGCKLDWRDEQQQASLESIMSPIMQQFREIEACIECSALKQIQVPEVFYYAQKAVLHPTAPLFDQEMQILKPRCMRALKRIFSLCDKDRDGALNDAELNDFQVRCFSAPLQSSEIAGVKKVVQDKLPEGVNCNGLTLAGFLFLHVLFIEKGRLETTWTVLRKFGYDNDMKFREDLIPFSFKRAPDQSVELTNDAVEFLKGMFFVLDTDRDGILQPEEVDDLFSTAPENPWAEGVYKDAAQRNPLGGLSLDGFLSLWALMTILEPTSSLVNLIYIGYPDDIASAFHITRRRKIDRKRQQSQRNVFQCYVFGPKNAGKSALLNALAGRPFSEIYTATMRDRFAVNVVELPGVTKKKTLALREIPEGGVKTLLANKEFLAPCDVAVFVYDSSNENSWRKSMELLVDIASHGEVTGFEVPCLIVPTKDDLDPSSMAVQDSTRVCRVMGVEAPIPVSMKLGDSSDAFGRIVSAAQCPHWSVPQTEAGKTRKQYWQFVNRSMMLVSVGAAVAIAGMAAYRMYAARKNVSG